MRFHRNRRGTKPEARTPMRPKGYGETAPSSLSSTPHNERALSRPRLLESSAVWPQRDPTGFCHRLLDETLRLILSNDRAGRSMSQGRGFPMMPAATRYTDDPSATMMFSE